MKQLAGKRVLVIEDEYFIAVDLQRALAGARADVVGPTGDLDKGLALAAAGAIDAAILDIYLEGTMSFPIADALADRSIPYLFLTGYDGWALPDRYRDVPRVAKPFPVDTVIRAVAQLVTA